MAEYQLQGKRALYVTLGAAMGTAIGAFLAGIIGPDRTLTGMEFLGILVSCALLAIFFTGFHLYQTLPDKVAQPIIERVSLIEEQFRLPPEGCMRWEYFHSKVRTLHKVVDSDYQPEIVVGVGRSGSIVAGLLAIFWDNGDVLCIDRNYGEPDQNGSIKVSFIPSVQLLQEQLEQKKVLFVMSEKDSGRTLEALLKSVNDLGMSSYKTAVVFNNAEKAPRPDYYAVADSGQRASLPFRNPNDSSQSKAKPNPQSNKSLETEE